MNNGPTVRSARGFALIADDFALTGPISRVILEFLECGIISGTGAMTNRPDWRASAPALRALAGRVDCGVHLNLTCAAPLTAMPKLARGGVLPTLAPLLKAGIMGQLPRAEIAAEINAQLTAFEDAMGMPPDFIDGHQHCHALSGVRDVFAEVIAQRYPDREPFIRDSADGIFAALRRRRNALKAIKISHLTRPLGKRVRASGFRTNEGFAGYSAFDTEADFAADFASYLVAPGCRHMVMCHPGAVDDELIRIDSATKSRESEAAFFRSSRYRDILAEAGMTPMRLGEL